MSFTTKTTIGVQCRRCGEEAEAQKTRSFDFQNFPDWGHIICWFFIDRDKKIQSAIAGQMRPHENVDERKVFDQICPRCVNSFSNWWADRGESDD